MAWGCRISAEIPSKLWFWIEQVFKSEVQLWDDHQMITTCHTEVTYYETKEIPCLHGPLQGARRTLVMCSTWSHILVKWISHSLSCWVDLKWVWALQRTVAHGHEQQGLLPWGPHIREPYRASSCCTIPSRWDACRVWGYAHGEFIPSSSCPYFEYPGI